MLWQLHVCSCIEPDAVESLVANCLIVSDLIASGLFLLQPARLAVDHYRSSAVVR